MQESPPLSIPGATLKKMPTYCWQEQYSGKFPRITKEFFRCRGNPLNPPIVQKKEGKDPVYYRDCSGCEHHGLPLREGKEFVYPILPELLNFLQEKTGKRVIITSGHRCREHNAYCDSSAANFGSKHMIGAEVDFYIQGMQKEPEKVIALLQSYYSGKEKELATFQRYDKEAVSIATPPWYNKEIFIKLFRENEGRDSDNAHGFPYISIQVRFDRDLNAKVTFEEAQSRNYLRY